MEKYKKWLLRMLFPHWVIIFLLTVVSAAGLTYVFLNGLDENPVAYALYVLAFYTLCTVVAAMPPVFRRCRAMVYSNKNAARYLSEKELRARISLYTGTVINLAYAVFKLIMGIAFRSIWFGAVAVYYMVLCLIRYFLLHNDRRRETGISARRLQQERWRIFHTCGWMLLLLNAAISGMVVQMIWQNRSYSYPGFVIYASAAYTFYRLTMGVIRNIKIRKNDNPIFTAAKVLDLSSALMSIYALQSAMITTFGTDMEEGTRCLFNSMTGSVVCVSVMVMAVFMIRRSRKSGDMS